MFKSQIGGLALNRGKWSEMGPEWSPGPENRSPGFPRPLVPSGFPEGARGLNCGNITMVKSQKVGPAPNHHIGLMQRQDVSPVSTADISSVV